MGTGNTYYNDQYQKKEVIKHRNEYIETLLWLHKRIWVWDLLSREEEDKYLEIRGKTLLPEAIPVDKELVIDNVSKHVHHMDDQEGSEDRPVMHPLFKQVGNQSKKNRSVNSGTRRKRALVDMS